MRFTCDRQPGQEGQGCTLQRPNNKRCERLPIFHVWRLGSLGIIHPPLLQTILHESSRTLAPSVEIPLLTARHLSMGLTTGVERNGVVPGLERG